MQGLTKHGFEQSKVDECVFYRGNVVFLLYVDDGILCSPDNSAIEKVIKQLQKDFEMTDEGALSEYLGNRLLSQSVLEH